MSTAVDHQVETGGAPQAGNSNQAGDGGPLMQGGLGPGALAMLALLTTMAMFSKITGIDAKQDENLTKAQSEEAGAEATSMINSGWAALAGAAASAAVTIGGSGLAYYAGKGSAEQQDEMSGLQKDAKALEKESNPMKRLTKMSDGVTSSKNLTQNNTKLTTRMNDLKSGNLNNVEDTPENNKLTLKALKQIRLEDKTNNTNNFDSLRKGLDKRIESNSRDINSKMTSQQTIMNNLTMKNTLFNNTSQTAGGLVKAGGDTAKAYMDADASLNRTAASMAGSERQSFNSAMSKAFDAQNMEVQILEKIHQANSVQA